MTTAIEYSVYVLVALLGVTQILISNSVIKQTKGSKTYNASYVGRNSRVIGYILLVCGLAAIIFGASNGAVYKWTSIVAGVFLIYWGIRDAVEGYHEYQEVKSKRDAHPFSNKYIAKLRFC